LPRFSGFIAAVVLAVGCAQPPAEPQQPSVEEKAKPGELPPLPATYVNTPGCPGCLGVTLTLRPDGSYLVRERVGTAEFYDFGRWRRDGDTLELVGGRDFPRRYALRGQDLDSQGGTQGGDLKRAPQLEILRGPFRMVGLYDGATFKECRTGIAWAFADTRAAKVLKEEFVNRKSRQVLVAVDAQFEGAPETLRVFRPVTLLTADACPG
jgi:hypothetical protein